MYCDFRPRLIGFHVLPASSVRKAPAAEIAMYIRPGVFGSSKIVCRHIPPAPGCHFGPVPWRSEEHTSELQSHSDLVCRLLLEKKKNTSQTAGGEWRRSTRAGTL